MKTQPQLFCCLVVIETNHPRDLPGAIFVLPEVDEAGFAHAFRVFMAGMVEAVDTDFDGAVSLHVVDLQRSRDEFSSHFAADVFLDAVGQCRSAERDPALIVIKLDVVGKQRRKLFEVAAIVGIEESGIERGNGFIQFGLRFDVVERGYSLSAGSRDGDSEQEQRHHCL